MVDLFYLQAPHRAIIHRKTTICQTIISKQRAPIGTKGNCLQSACTCTCTAVIGQQLNVQPDWTRGMDAHSQSQTND
jgi:hypothetical protein